MRTGFLWLLSLLSEGKLYALDELNYEQFLNNNEKTAIGFITDSCQSCVSMLKDWNDASIKLGGQVKLAKMDMSFQKGEFVSNLKEELKITGYPAIMYFENGKVVDVYSGHKRATSLVGWVRHLLSDVISHFSTADEFEGIRMQDPEERYLIYTGPQDGTQWDVYSEFCATHRSLIYCIADNNTIDLDHSDMTLLRPSREKSFQIMADEITEDDIEDFVVKEYIEWFAPITTDTYYQYTRSRQEIVWFVGTKAEYEQVSESGIAAAKQLRGKLVFIWIDRDEQPVHVEKYFKSQKYPGFFIRNDNGNLQGLYVGPKKLDITTDELVAFGSKYQAGQWGLKLRSEAPAPRKSNELVVKAVGDDINDILSNEESYILFIHGESCGSTCKEFMPVMEGLSVNLKRLGDSTLFVEIDGDKNEFNYPGIEYMIYPTIYLKPANREEPLKFYGSRRPVDFAIYVKQHGWQKYTYEEIMGLPPREVTGSISSTTSSTNKPPVDLAAIDVQKSDTPEHNDEL